MEDLAVSSASVPPHTTHETASSYWTPLSLRFLIHKIIMMITAHCDRKIKYRVGKKSRFEVVGMENNVIINKQQQQE